MTGLQQLTKLSDGELLDQTDRLVKIETETTTAILHHLKEIDDRKLYAEKNCDSLFTYCTRILRYSESQAHRRITAARLLRQIPDLDRKIQDGRLTLTNIAQAHSFFLFENRSGRQVTIERKREILSKLEDKSTREAEKILIAEHPSDRPINRESIRFITDSAIELKIVLDIELLRKLTRVKVLAGHKLPQGSWADVINMMCDEVLERRDPMEKAKRAAKREINSATHVGVSESEPNQKKPNYREPNQFPSLSFGRAPVPASLRHQVWLRDVGRCSHIDRETGKRCDSSLRVEIDHIRPVAAGGRNEISNLRLLCRGHNQRRNVVARWKSPETSEPP